jgi:glucosamine 6-phosphate synthetase-like amidotransferase/phosphosugar isomerase protein
LCGLAGFIGKAKNPKLSYQIITSLLEKSQARGIDAAGFWGTSENSTFYHKEPGPACCFIQRNKWKKLEKYNPNLLLAHARGASKGSGLPKSNKNNHPFISTNKNIGLIHNGKIEEYKYLKQNYRLETECDSEVLLRIFEKKENLEGITDIFDLVTTGHMAVAIGQKDSQGKHLWLFRNRYRPLWIINAYIPLGQVFFISELNFWTETTCRLRLKGIEIYELPTEEVWKFTLSNDLLFKIYKI